MWKATAEQAVDMLMKKVVLHLRSPWCVPTHWITFDGGQVQERGAVAIFEDLDFDRSGSISASEFRYALRKLGIGLVNKHVDALIKVSKGS